MQNRTQHNTTTTTQHNEFGLPLNQQNLGPLISPLKGNAINEDKQILCLVPPSGPAIIRRSGIKSSARLDMGPVDKYLSADVC